METIQTTALLRSARILRRVLETCSHTDSSERISANAKNSHGRGGIIIILVVVVWTHSREVDIRIYKHKNHGCFKRIDSISDSFIYTHTEFHNQFQLFLLEIRWVRMAI